MNKEQIKALFDIEVYPADLNGKNVWFTDERIKHFPSDFGLYKYEIRHDDDGRGDPCEISTKILVNFYGTIISSEEILLPKTSLTQLKYDDMSIEDLHVDYSEPIPIMDIINNKRKENERKSN